MQERSGLEGHGAVSTQKLAHRKAHVGGLEGLPDVLHRHAGAGHALYIQPHHHCAARAADGPHLLGTGYSL